MQILATLKNFTVTIIRILIINVKSFLERHFLRDLNWQFSKILLCIYEGTFIKKLYCIQPLWYTAKLDKFTRSIQVQTKEMAQKWRLWQELLKSTSKIGKPSHDWMTWCTQQFEGKSYVVVEDLNLLTNLGRSIFWAYKLKALKSSS